MFITVYCLTEGSDALFTADLWDWVEEVIGNYGGRSRILIGVDSNGHVGEGRCADNDGHIGTGAAREWSSS